MAITPTVGRVVWFFRTQEQRSQPEAAIITCVHGDRMVNLAVFDPNGVSRPVTSVTLVQEGDAIPPGIRCEWMPYQKGQAAKTEALEKSARELGIFPSAGKSL